MAVSTSTLQTRPVMPDVVPHISPRRIPDLPVISHREDKPESMQISPDQKPEKSPLPMVYKKPELKPIPNIKPSSSNDDSTQSSTSAEASDTVNAPWKPKLRKVERPAKAAKPDPPPTLAPKPKLKPVTNRLSQAAQLAADSEKTQVASINNNKSSLPHLQSIDKSSLEEKIISPPKQESVSASSLPQKTMVPPLENPSKPVRLKPMTSSKPSLPQGNTDIVYMLKVCHPHVHAPHYMTCTYLILEFGFEIVRWFFL